MITIEEIKKKSSNIYIDILRAGITQEVIFPKLIRSNKSLSVDFETMSKELAPIIEHSKERKGYGYTIAYTQKNTRNHGRQDIPEEIKFETIEDYLAFTKREKDYSNFLTDTKLIIESFPELKNQLINTPLIVIENHSKWPELLAVCDWFKNNFEPDRYYIRELPIQSIHTKFIENNKGVLKTLLDIIVPGIINAEEIDFEKRYRLKFNQPLIRLRVLDKSLAVGNKFTDISLPVAEFQQARFDCTNIFITENIMNFLTLPPIPNTIALWGGGFGIEKLKNIQWLQNMNIYYWGDIDTHGLQILSQLRNYYAHVISVMMDDDTLQAHQEYCGVGKTTNVINLSGLTEDEISLFKLLKEQNIRLEQERIPQSYATIKILTSLINH